MAHRVLYKEKVKFEKAKPLINHRLAEYIILRY